MASGSIAAMASSLVNFAAEDAPLAAVVPAAAEGVASGAAHPDVTTAVDKAPTRTR